MDFKEKGQNSQQLETMEAEVPLKEGSFRVQVEIHECRDLQPRVGLAQTANPFGNKAGSADPLVEVELLYKKQQTKVLKKTLNPIFQSTLFFNLEKKTIEELETAQFVFRVMDYNKLTRDSIIGAFSIDFETVYKSPQHEIYRTWGALVDITDEVEGIQGYIKFSIQILGEGDEQKVHDRAKEKLAQEKKGKSDQFALMMPPSIQQKGYQIDLRLHRAEHLAPVDLSSNTCDAFCILNYAGSQIRSKTVQSNRNPVFNQKLTVGTAIPNQAGKISIEIIDRNIGSGDVRIGTVRIPFVDLQNEKKQKMLNTARWYNLYGPALFQEGVIKDNPEIDLMTKYQDRGSHYRGRVLISIKGFEREGVKNEATDIEYDFPNKIPPNPPSKKYTLRIDAMEGTDLPSRGECCLHFSIGPYFLSTQVVKMIKSKALFYEQLQEIQILMPEDKSMLPDFFIYLSQGPGEGQRICYARVQASNLFFEKEGPQNK